MAASPRSDVYHSLCRRLTALAKRGEAAAMGIAFHLGLR